MCNTRAYKHSCGHVTTHLVSTCRGTYSCPKSERVLCHASPSLVVAAPERCRNCQWSSFSRLWDGRIAEAQAKLSVATQVQMELQDDWVEADVSTAIEANDFGEADRAAERLSAAKDEARRAQNDVEYLATQYEREKRTRWRPTLSSLQPVEKKSKKRSPSLKGTGSSPLKKAQSIDDVMPEPSETEEERVRRQSFESIGSEGSAPELSDCNDSSPPETPPGSPPFGKTRFSFDNFGSSWGKSMSAEPTIIGDEDEDLLPNFGLA